MQSDVISDAALCERLRELVTVGASAPISFHVGAEIAAADRLESLSRQLSDAQRERDELRAAVTRAITTPADAKHDMWLKAQNAAFRSVLAMMGNSGHTEGGKP